MVDRVNYHGKVLFTSRFLSGFPKNMDDRMSPFEPLENSASKKKFRLKKSPIDKNQVL